VEIRADTTGHGCGSRRLPASQCVYVEYRRFLLLYAAAPFLCVQQQQQQQQLVLDAAAAATVTGSALAECGASIVRTNMLAPRQTYQALTGPDCMDRTYTPEVRRMQTERMPLGNSAPQQSSTTFASAEARLLERGF